MLIRCEGIHLRVSAAVSPSLGGGKPGSVSQRLPGSAAGPLSIRGVEQAWTPWGWHMPTRVPLRR